MFPRDSTSSAAGSPAAVRSRADGPHEPRTYVPLRDYAAIGDCHGGALVARDGGIDWCCLARFDADPVLMRILDAERGGHCSVGVANLQHVERGYEPGTNILRSEFHTASGVLVVTDFMPVARTPGAGANAYTDLVAPGWLVRRLEVASGEVDVRCEFRPTLGFSMQVPRLRTHGGGVDAVDVALWLRSDLRWALGDADAFAQTRLMAGERRYLALGQGRHRPDADEIDAVLAATRAFWTEWTAISRYRGPYGAMVERSALALKLLSYSPTGASAAALTTSLPEHVGGERNWDYRFCWLRDATLTLLALMNAGYFEEAQAWRDWLLRAAMGSPSQIQIMYGLRGERRLTEWQVPWLAGYENSAPVRIGNAAHNQRQLDIFGEVMDALHQAREGGLPQIDAGWDLQQALLAHLEKIWVERDNGIWEVRSGREHFTFSKVMAWVAFDRAIKSAEAFNLPGPVEHWREIRDHIHNDVCERGFDSELVSFVRAYGSKELDASLLLLPALGFLPPEDPRIRATVEAIERELVADGLVLRYDTGKSEDGLPSGEGVFLACSFWLVDAYLMLGRRDDAVALFERLLALRNDVGLLSEEYEPRSKRLVGNFPQAFSHLALVNSASNLAHYKKPAEQRSQHTVKGSP